MIFNSRPINTDPKPYVHNCVGCPNDGYRVSEVSGRFRVSHEPRPEYDNNPNPILIDVRLYRSERSPMNNPKGWGHVLRRFQTACGTTQTPFSNAYTRNYTLAEVEHARKVLTRLAALGE